MAEKHSRGEVSREANPTMTQNYRVVRLTNRLHDEWLEIRVAYYSESNEPFFRTGTCWVAGSTMDELRSTLSLMKEALDKPILTLSDFAKTDVPNN